MSFKSLKTIADKLAVFGLLIFSGSAFAEGAPAKYDFQEPVTSLGRTARDQHHLTFWICVVIAIVVFGVMIYSLIAHRKSKGVTPATFHESTTIEVLWTIVPFLILAVLGVYATDSLIEYEDSSNSVMTIKVTGKRWYWVYEYHEHNGNVFYKKGVAETPDMKLAQKGKVRFESHLKKSHKDASILYNKAKNKDLSRFGNTFLLEVDRRLVIPTNTRIRFLIKSDDVIHAWWVPQFGLKKDAIPGYVNTTWAVVEKPGVYRGQCAELCGREHAYMPIVVEAMPKDKFMAWYKKQKASAGKTVKIGSSKADLMKAGAAIYAKKCASCHQAGGQGIPPTFPALKGSKIVNGPAKDHINIVVKGKKAMPKFDDMSDDELAAVITYERNAWGNKGSVVKPADVKKAR